MATGDQNLPNDAGDQELDLELEFVPADEPTGGDVAAPAAADAPAPPPPPPAPPAPRAPAPGPGAALPDGPSARFAEDIGIEIIIEPDVMPQGSLDFLRYPVYGGARPPAPAPAPAPAPVPVPVAVAAAAPVPVAAPAPVLEPVGAGVPAYGPPDDWPHDQDSFGGSTFGAIKTLFTLAAVIVGFTAMLAFLYLIMTNPSLLGTQPEGTTEVANGGNPENGGGTTVDVDVGPPGPAPSGPIGITTPEGPTAGGGGAAVVTPEGGEPEGGEPEGGEPENPPVAPDAGTSTPEVSPAIARLREIEDQQRKLLAETPRAHAPLLAGGPAALAAAIPHGTIDRKGPLPPTPPLVSVTFEEEYEEPGIPDRIAALRREALELEAKGKFEEALGKWNELLEIVPHEPEALFATGYLHQALGRPDEALAQYEKNLQVDHPTNVRSLNNMGLIHESTGDLAAARKAYETAIARDPAFGHALTNLGNIELAEGQVEAAVGHYGRAVESDPSLHVARLNHALALTQTGDLAGARSELETLQGADGSPLAAETHEGLGRLAAAEGDHESAIGLYEKALELDPFFTLARNNLGVSLIELERAEDAIGHLRRVTEEAPGDPSAWTNFGHANVAANRLQTAKQAYEKALDIDEDLVEARYNYALCAERFGNYPYAMVEYERVLKLAPTHDRALNNLGLIYRRAAILDEASERTRSYLDKSLDLFERSIAANPTPVEPKINLIASLIDLGQKTDADLYLDRYREEIGKAKLSDEAKETLEGILRQLDADQSLIAPPPGNLGSRD